MGFHGYWFNKVGGSSSSELNPKPPTNLNLGNGIFARKYSKSTSFIIKVEDYKPYIWNGFIPVPNPVPYEPHIDEQVFTFSTLCERDFIYGGALDYYLIKDPVNPVYNFGTGTIDGGEQLTYPYTDGNRLCNIDIVAFVSLVIGKYGTKDEELRERFKEEIEKALDKEFLKWRGGVRMMKYPHCYVSTKSPVGGKFDGTADIETILAGSGGKFANQNSYGIVDVITIIGEEGSLDLIQRHTWTLNFGVDVYTIMTQAFLTPVSMGRQTLYSDGVKITTPYYNEYETFSSVPDPTGITYPAYGIMRLYAV